MIGKWKNNLRSIEPYVPGEQAKGKIVKLNANENPYPPSPKVIEELQSFDANQLRLYPDAAASRLKNALANHLGLQSSQVFVGNGSDEVIAFAFMACFQSEQPILFPDITYSFYPVWCNLLEIPYKTIPLDDGFSVQTSDYMQKNGGIILPNPNAPTGMGLPLDAIETILQQNQDSIVIIDEAYVDFGCPSAVPLLEKYENLLIVQTFSKSRSLAGMRIGMAFGNELIIGTLEAIKNSYNSYTMDSLAIHLGAASIEDTSYFDMTIKKIIATREKTSQTLTDLGFQVFPSQSNFLFVTHPAIKAQKLFEALRKENIFIRYFSLPRIDNHLRITIGTEEEMNLLLEAIIRLLPTLQQ